MSISVAVNCASSEVYVKFTKKTLTLASQESFKILSGSQVLYTSPSLTNNQERVLEVCLPQTTNNQYTLGMYDTSSYWSSGAWLMIEGINGNRVFKGMVTSSKTQEQPLSLYSPINKDDTWKYTATPSGNWKEVSYSDAGWTDVTLEISPIQATGTQYFRKSFAGLSGMAAIEFQLNYRYGIVAYINGNEVYRDNMADGEPTSSTLATGSYMVYDYHGVIRPSTIAESSSSVLAVEVHFLSTDYSELIQFNGFLAFYAGISTSDLCFVVPNDVTATGTSFTTPANAFSWTYSTSAYFTSTYTSGTLTAEYQGASLPMVNSVRIWPYTSTTTHVVHFLVEGAASSLGPWTPILETDGGTYTSSQWKQWDSVAPSPRYSLFRLTAYKRGTGSTYVNELQYLVCNRAIPSTIPFSETSYSYYKGYEQVDIAPTQYGFSSCSISPALPDGVSLDPNTCKISGISTVTGTQTYTISSAITTPAATGLSLIHISEPTRP